jgi:hypothetical protein
MRTNLYSFVKAINIFGCLFSTATLVIQISPVIAETDKVLIIAQSATIPDINNQNQLPPAQVGQIQPASQFQSPTGQFQQNGVIFNNDSFSSLINQNCAGGCLYLTVKNTSSPSAQNATEVSVGGLWQLNSPDASRAELARISSEPARLDAQLRQKNSNEENITALRRELVSAIENKKIASAILISKQLAPKLGYQDHWQLLAELGLGKTMIEQSLKSAP